MTKRFAFTLSARDGRARCGCITMHRGTIRTPAFMPVGTAATVKAMRPDEVRASGADIILGNSYHLMLRPGAQRIARLGGLHHFMGWEHPILTDSGGYQVMSLSSLTKVSEEGVVFQSHIDGSRHTLTPQSVVHTQSLLGSDIAMVLDECPAHDVAHNHAATAMGRSMRWAAQARGAFDKLPDYSNRAALFAIQQGALDKELRAQSAQTLQEIGFDGYAIGGLAVGEGQAAMFAVLDYAPEQLPTDCPRYLMGVGKPDDIVGAVARGVDMFDCVLPTRSGRNGQAFTHRGPLNLRNARFAEDQAPLDTRCKCPTCQRWTRAYLHHLIRTGEILGSMLMTDHNIHFYQNLMKTMRAAIVTEKFANFARDFLHSYRSGET